MFRACVLCVSLVILVIASSKLLLRSPVVLQLFSLARHIVPSCSAGMQTPSTNMACCQNIVQQNNIPILLLKSAALARSSVPSLGPHASSTLQTLHSVQETSLSLFSSADALGCPGSLKT